MAAIEEFILPPEADIEGWLWKEGEKNLNLSTGNNSNAFVPLVPTWRRRWFVVEGDEIAYYKTDTKRDKQGTIPFAHITSVTDPSCIDEYHGRKFIIVLETGNRNFYLSCSDAKEKETWVRSLYKLTSFYSKLPPKYAEQLGYQIPENNYLGFLEEEPAYAGKFEGKPQNFFWHLLMAPASLPLSLPTSPSGSQQRSQQKTSSLLSYSVPSPSQSKKIYTYPVRSPPSPPNQPGTSAPIALSASLPAVPVVKHISSPSLSPSSSPRFSGISKLNPNSPRTSMSSPTEQRSIFPLSRRRSTGSPGKLTPIKLESTVDPIVEEEAHIITLNVGGRKFQTTLKTLMKFPNSYFTQPNVYQVLCSNQEVFIDRNGDLFVDILDYLRDGEIYLPPVGSKELWKLQKEAEFFGLHELLEQGENKKQSHPVVPIINTGSEPLSGKSHNSEKHKKSPGQFHKHSHPHTLNPEVSALVDDPELNFSIPINAATTNVPTRNRLKRNKSEVTSPHSTF